MCIGSFDESDHLGSLLLSALEDLPAESSRFVGHLAVYSNDVNLLTFLDVSRRPTIAVLDYPEMCVNRPSASLSLQHASNVC